MNRAELKQLIFDDYDIRPDCPWTDEPNYEVFRHPANRKWFALIMDIPRNKLGLKGKEPLSVVNFKCDPILIGALIGQPGIFPAYHMNKSHWITIALDGTAQDETIKMLLDVSYTTTALKIKAPKQ